MCWAFCYNMSQEYFFRKEIMYLKYFKYYKGEKKCPFERDDKKFFYWSEERSLYEAFHINPELEARLKAQAEIYTKNLCKQKKISPLSKKFLTYSEQMKVIALGMEAHLQKFNPYECDKMLLEY